MSEVILRSVDFVEGDYDPPAGTFIFKFDAETDFVEGEFSVKIATKGDLAAAERGARAQLATFLRELLGEA